jgi:hypothetical protein
MFAVGVIDPPEGVGVEIARQVHPSRNTPIGGRSGGPEFDR